METPGCVCWCCLGIQCHSRHLLGDDLRRTRSSPTGVCEALPRKFLGTVMRKKNRCSCKAWLTSVSCSVTAERLVSPGGGEMKSEADGEATVSSRADRPQDSVCIASHAKTRGIAGTGEFRKAFIHHSITFSIIVVQPDQVFDNTIRSANQGLELHHRHKALEHNSLVKTSAVIMFYWEQCTCTLTNAQSVMYSVLYKAPLFSGTNG